MAESASVTYKSNADAILAAIEAASTEGPKEAVDAMVADGQKFVPVKSGRLQRTIRREPGENKYSQDFVAGGDDAPYAGFVNFGTRFMRANPFFTAAFEAHAGDVVDAFLKRLYGAGQAYKASHPKPPMTAAQHAAASRRAKKAAATRAANRAKKAASQ